MGGPENSNNFLIGNVILGVALLLLLFMGRAWEVMGVAAMVLWIALVVAGVYFLMQDRGKSG
jgi:hypothetical protein